jgi:hypothetical protein
MTESAIRDRDGAADPVSAASALWTMFLDDGTAKGVRVECTAEKIGEFILARRAGPMTNAIAPGSTARVPLAALPLFAPFFSADDRRHALEMSGQVAAALDPSLREALEAQVASRRGAKRPRSLRILAILCKVCAWLFVAIGALWLLAAFSAPVRVQGLNATVGLMVAILLALVPILAIPILFFTLAGLANGLADLLEDRLVARLRQH